MVQPCGPSWLVCNFTLVSTYLFPPLPNKSQVKIEMLVEVLTEAKWSDFHLPTAYKVNQVGYREAWLIIRAN